MGLRRYVPAPIRALARRYLPAPIRSWLLRLADPEWHRRAVGGLWEEIGRLQLDFLVDRGLRPEHHLLDIGCGSLRGGLHFVRYLETGHYVGVDVDPDLLAAGRFELRREGLLGKQPRLVEMGDFDFASLGMQFEYAVAVSVFTHLPLNRIIRCLVNVDRVLAPGGTFFATFFEHPEGRLDLGPVRHDSGVVTYLDRDPYHYDVDTFKWACRGTGLKVGYIGEWAHRRNQRMLAFRKGK